MAQSIVLPPIIKSPEEVMQFYYLESEPNYITIKHSVGRICLLEEGKCMGEMDDRIVLISSADPGYDWIFSHKIKGFITMYGGTNSRMAILAGELSIPAVVGVGDKKYVKFKKAQILEIDTAGKLVRILK